MEIIFMNQNRNFLPISVIILYGVPSQILYLDAYIRKVLDFLISPISKLAPSNVFLEFVYKNDLPLLRCILKCVVNNNNNIIIWVMWSIRKTKSLFFGYRNMNEIFLCVCLTRWTLFMLLLFAFIFGFSRSLWLVRCSNRDR